MHRYARYAIDAPWYCGWKKSCTRSFFGGGKNQICRFSSIPGGAGILPGGLPHSKLKKGCHWGKNHPTWATWATWATEIESATTNIRQLMFRWFQLVSNLSSQEQATVVWLGILLVLPDFAKFSIVFYPWRSWRVGYKMHSICTPCVHELASLLLRKPIQVQSRVLFKFE